MAQIVQAGGVVLLDRGVVLRRTVKGEWIFPKGDVEEGELLREAAVREVAEETGLRCQVLFKAGEISYHLGDDEYLVHLFAMEARKRLPFWRHHEGKDAFVFAPEEALGRVTFPDTREVLEKVLVRLEGFYFPACQKRHGVWRDRVKGDPVEWLLEWEYPSIRYYTLRHLLEKPEGNDGVVAAKKAIMAKPPVTDILALQRPDGSWQEGELAYSPMHKSTIWQVVYLAEHGADSQDERIERAMEYVFESMQASDGSFPSQTRAYGGSLLCYEGITNRALLLLGYGQDPRVERGIDYLTRAVREEGFRCRYNGGQSCAWGAIKALRALMEILPQDRTPQVKGGIAQGANFLLSRDLSEADYPRKRKISAHWFNFGFPRAYNSDILEALEALARLGYAKDERLHPAIGYLLSKQDEEGRWKMEFSLNGRMLVDIERRGKPSKWLTLRALGVLKAANG